MATLCTSCKSTIDEANDVDGLRSPCPSCGSLSRYFEDDLESTAAAGALMHTKGYAGGKSKSKGLLFESKDGDSYCYDLSRFVHFHQLFDHVNKWVTKSVIDPVTGDVLREVDHAMEEHRDRGSAKKRDP
jgi:hypothetical protein